MSHCATLISQGYEKACTRKAKQGYKKECILINYDDIDFANIVRNATPGSENLVTTLPLFTGKQGYAINQFFKPFQGSGRSFVRGTYIGTWTKKLGFVTLTKDQAQNLNLHDGLANGKFVAIIQNEDMGSDNKCAFEILGLTNGLTLTSCENDPYSEDVYNGDIFSLEETGADESAIYLWNTSYATTKAAYESYKTPVSVQ